MESFFNAYYFSLILLSRLLFTIKEGMGDGRGGAGVESSVAQAGAVSWGVLLGQLDAGRRQLGFEQGGARFLPAAPLSHSQLGDQFHPSEPFFFFNPSIPGCRKN